jgi:putative FmdB family regulatory protein
MPIYEYRCQSCEIVFDVLQSINAEPLTKCQECDGAVTKLVSRSAFQLKGSGWYVTDYAQKSGDPQGNASTTHEKTDSPADKKPASDNAKSTTTETGKKTSSSEASSSV